MNQWVVVGLGNPGKKYEMTRHNMGYLVVQELAKSLGCSFKKESRFFSWVAKASAHGSLLHFLLPTTYMNESGRAVRSYLNFLKLPIESLIIVSDDVTLPFGKLRLRTSGSSGGHNGLKSIGAQMGSMEFSRLKVGVGVDPKADPQDQNKIFDLADYVLAPFSKKEKEELSLVKNEAVQTLLHLFQENEDL